jgi:hypothetical protein
MAKLSKQEFEEYISLLGAKSVDLVPIKDVHTAKKIGDDYHRIPYKDIDRLWIEDSVPLRGYDSLKIDLSSALPKDHSYVLLDFDDKKETGTIFSGIKTSPTLTIKTPTGAGEQRLYIAPKSFTDTLTKNKFILGSKDGSQLEIFIIDGRRNVLSVLPGHIKDGKQYKLVNSRPPALLDAAVMEVLTLQSSSDKSHITHRVKFNADKFNSEPDSPSNRKEYRRYLQGKRNQILDDGAPIIGEGTRDDTIWSFVCEGATYNLTPQTITDILIAEITHHSDVFDDPSDEFTDEQILYKAKRAVDAIAEARRTNERALGSIVPWARNPETGIPDFITRKDIEERAKHIGMRGQQYLRQSPTNQNLFIETIAQDYQTALFYVPKFVNSPYYKEKYETTLMAEIASEDLDINIDIIRDRPRLEFHKYNQANLNQIYTIADGNKEKGITLHPKFYSLISHGKVERKLRPDYYRGGVVSIYSEPPVMPSETITEERLKKVDFYLRRHFSRLLPKDNFEEEYQYHLSWYAKKVQDPENRNKTILYYSGPQGSGKSVFVQLVGLMMQHDDFQIIANSKELKDDSFLTPASLMFLDEGNIADKEILEIVKAIATTPTKNQNAKYRDRENVSVFTDLIVANNAAIPEELDYERRVIPAEGERAFDSELVNREVREFLLECKKNDWEMLRDIAHVLKSRDLTHFNSKYEPKGKPRRRLIRSIERRKTIMAGLVNMIANYGYAYGKPVLVPKHKSNLYDIIAALTVYYPSLGSESVPEINKLKCPKGAHIKDLWKVGDSYFAEIQENFNFNWPVSGTKTSKFHTAICDSSSTSQTNARIVPPIQKWIEFLTFIIHKKTDQSLVDQIITLFGFEEQMKWDNETPPKIENLGSIDKTYLFSDIIGDEFSIVEKSETEF